MMAPRGPLAALALFLAHVSVSVALYGGLSGTSKATWYGEPEGDGTDGGACGYGPLSPTPYKKIIAAGSAPLFLNGAGCGACYKVQCTSSSLCSATGVAVAMTDLCPGGDFCGGGNTHFDLSGAAFGALAVPGRANDLRTLGVLTVAYERTPCNFGSQNLLLRILPGFNAYYVGVVPGGGAGPGSVAAMAIKQAKKASFQPLAKDWGASFSLLSSTPLTGPFTVRLTASATGEVITCPNKIPTAFVAGKLYDCGAQFSRGAPTPSRTARPPPKGSPPSKGGPTVIISQKLLSKYPSPDGKSTVFSYSVSFKNIGTKPLLALVVEATNYRPLSSYNIVPLGGNRYTLPSYAFPLKPKGSFDGFGYQNVGGGATFRVV